ncbi:KRFB protein, partial [Calcarius ornatus]|nr:KRFB protein [Calcarius ornatus]
MSCYDLCRPCGPTPLANSCNEPCVRQCQDSRPDFPPYSVIYPGPTLTTFPQQTLVGSTALLDIRNFLGSQGFLGFG